MNKEKIIEELGDVSLQCYGQGEIYYYANIERVVDKIIQEVKQEEQKKIKQNIGFLRQYLNEKINNMSLITNKELEEFLIKKN